MPNSHRRRGRSVSRESRHHRRDVRSRSRESRSRGRISRSRGRESHNSRLDLQGNRIPRQPDIASNSLLTQQMQQILDRLTSLEEDRRVSRAASLRQPSNQQQQLVEETATTARDGAGFRDSAAPSSPGRSVSAAADRDATVTDRLIDAIRSINTTVRSNQAYFISNFDPSVNDIDTWCEEVDRAKVSNNWTDNECLSRIGNCLKGDSKTWLNEWVTSDRTWSNFIREFKPLCPRKPDVANILYEVMSTNSDRYPTYADYARRSLLRLRIVKGLSDELISAIVIRGVMDPQIRAAATNAKLMPNELVEYLSIYVKSNLNSKSIPTLLIMIVLLNLPSKQVSVSENSKMAHAFCVGNMVISLRIVTNARLLTVLIIAMEMYKEIIQSPAQVKQSHVVFAKNLVIG
ncbi:hypothetical protein HF086_006329 [Spodoptera exigua]|uniref:Uncharacterized protein n=1 Tax=Spodoptera exigua TaxID=7107 RepID=A0A922MR69_SPOEX|nr:hypothetical protein HF086_006329 [Spodoptera exigua]